MAKNNRPHDNDQDYDPNPVTIEGDDSGPSLLSPAADDTTNRRGWYVVHCYSGHENKVKQALLQRIQSMGMKDRIFDVLVPTAEQIEVKEGKQKKVEKRIFPGYVLVEMILNESALDEESREKDREAWFVVRNTPGVTGFVGADNEPTALAEEEVRLIMRKMESVEPMVRINFKVGDKVRIISGPFNDITGDVGEIYPDRNKVRVMVSFFGRETPVEVDFLEVEKA